MSAGYRPAKVEARHYQRWEEAGCFAPTGDGNPYCIVIPPPNVTGTLHMGHAFQCSIMDALIRYHRMRGDKTLWQHGTDHAGIATQMVVERLLNAEGSSRQKIGREQFVQRVMDWKDQSSGTISSQLRRIGASVDWTRERFTMDEGLSQAVVETFVRLHDDGLIYRGKRLVNWDPVLHTALSDLEVLSTEEQGNLWHFRYPLVGEKAYLVVATTRPETMLGDSAVAVHPDDSRYRHLVGKQVQLPLTGRTIPIIADEYVDPEFGTGCVKITPAHDFNDYEVGLRHSLPQLNILDDNASINNAAPEAYRGLDRFVARQRVVADMEAAKLLDKTETHTMMVPRGDRSGSIVEPYLTDQWYVQVAPLAAPAIEAVEQGRIRFVPENWSKTYFEWMRNIQDWCISRQLWWGHRIPAWYDADGNIYVAHNEEEARSKYDLADNIELSQDTDVLDTWFSSALWPFSTLGWPDQTNAFEDFYPTNVLVTGFDIIFFWVARMIMMGLKLTDEVPFHEVYIHGLVRDHEGQKMSKSKGNILDPIDLIDGINLEDLVAKRTGGLMQPHLRASIEKATRKEFPEGIPAFGTDALRFTFLSLATTGRDIRFDLNRIGGYHRFCNKLWNAAGFVFTQIEVSPASADTQIEPTTADRWIRSRLGQLITVVDAAFASYRFDLAAQALYDFTWHEFCDWYLELTKPILANADTAPGEAASTRATLTAVLGALLKLLHPLTPYITEELWQSLCAKTTAPESLLIGVGLPLANDFPSDDEAEREINWIQAFIGGVRQIRGEMNISASAQLDVRLADATNEDLRYATRHANLLRKLARLDAITPTENAPAGAATALLGEMRLLVPLAGVIDASAERERLTKQLRRTETDLKKSSGKLANANFVKNAPDDVVAKERERIEEFEQRTTRLQKQLDVLANL